MSEWMDAPDGPGDFWYAKKGGQASLCQIEVVPEAKCGWCRGTGRIPEVRHPPRTLAWTVAFGSNDPGTNLDEHVVPEHECEGCHGKGIVPEHFLGTDEYGDGFIPGAGLRWKRADVPVAG